MVPLPVIAEPFHRIAMDIVGPLPRSSSDKRFILVMPLVTLRSIDAEHVAEALMTFFSRVGVAPGDRQTKVPTLRPSFWQNGTGCCMSRQLGPVPITPRQMVWLSISTIR